MSKKKRHRNKGGNVGNGSRNQPASMISATNPGPHRIITFLTPLTTKKPADMLAPAHYAYPPKDQRGNNMLDGVLSNEAPVKYILEKWEARPRKGVSVVCLCTEDAKKKISWPDAGVNNETTFEYFQRVICRSCGWLNLEDVIPIDVYMQAMEINMEEALAEILKEIRRGDTVHIDTTGGLRDANFLNLLLMQALQYKGCKIGDIVYAYYDRGTQMGEIRLLDYIPRITNTISAMSELTTYGRTRLFDNMSKNLDKDTRNLIQKMRTFSDSLEASAFSIGGKGPNWNDLVKDVSRTLMQCGQSDKVPPLMKELLPVFREKITMGSSSVTLSSVVHWCAENHLLQQGVVIFHENLPAELRTHKILTVMPDEPEEPGEETKTIKCFKNLTRRFVTVQP